MNTVTVHKEELRGIIQANRAEHQEDFNEAVQGYRQTILADLEAHIERIKKGSLTQVRIIHPVPVDHTQDYDRVLRMIDMHINDTIEISQGDFARYVQDTWDWKDQFGSVAAGYTTSAKFDQYR